MKALLFFLLLNAHAQGFSVLKKLLTSATVLSSCYYYNQRPRPVDPLQNKSREIIRENFFNVNRSLKIYQRFFGNNIPYFTKSDVLIDSGAGEGMAIHQIKLESNPYVTLITYYMTPRRQKNFTDEKSHLVMGKYFEDTSNSEILKFGRANALFDVYGVFSYTNRPDVVLDRYLQLILPEGKIFLYSSQFEDKEKRTVIIDQGIEKTLMDWIQMNPSILVDRTGKGIVITKKKNTQEFKKLQLIDIDLKTQPPYRRKYMTISNIPFTFPIFLGLFQSDI